MKSTMMQGEIDRPLLDKIRFYYFSGFSANKMNKNFYTDKSVFAD